MASAPSMDIGAVGHSAKGDWETWVPEEETSRATLHLSRETDEDISPVGFAIDPGVPENLIRGSSKEEDEKSEGEKAWPTLMVLDADGTLTMFRIRHASDTCSCLVPQRTRSSAKGGIKDVLSTASPLSEIVDTKPERTPSPPPLSRTPLAAKTLEILSEFDKEVQKVSCEWDELRKEGVGGQLSHELLP